jgi:hypothetical protein
LSPEGVQTAVDAKCHLIIAHEVTKVGHDTPSPTLMTMPPPTEQMWQLDKSASTGVDFDRPDLERIARSRGGARPSA